MKIAHTVVELDGFAKAAHKLLSPEEIGELIAYLALRPDAGDVMPGTGGFRKLRWSRQGMGKKGGTRVIYFLHNEDFPLFLYTIYAKNERANLTKAERNILSKAGSRILQEYGG